MLTRAFRRCCRGPAAARRDQAQPGGVFALALADHDQTPASYDEVRGRACLSRECKAANAVPASSASDDDLTAIIDAQTSPETLAAMIAKLREGPLKERAKKKFAALRESQVANLSVALPFPRRKNRPRREATNGPRARDLFRNSILLRRSILSCSRRTASWSRRARGQDGQALGRGQGPPAEHLQGPFWLGQVSRVLAGRQAGRVGLRRQDGQALGRGERPRAAPLRGPFELGNVGRLLAGRQAGRVGELRTRRSGSGTRRAAAAEHARGPFRLGLSVAFSPDGKLLASGTDDRRSGSGTRRAAAAAPLEGHSGLCRSVAFSPDGKLVASEIGTRRSGSGTRRTAV